MQSHARVVVVGGGVVGCSILYHLTEAGWTDAVLLEQYELTSGSTWHAAGLLPLFNMSYAGGLLHRYSIDLYARLAAEWDRDVGLRRVGNLRMARTRERMEEFQTYATTAESIGTPHEWWSADDIKRRFPLVRTEDLKGALFHPTDGYINPADITLLLADAARRNGATIHRGVTVTALTKLPSGEWKVTTDAGDIVCDVVVAATGNHALRTAAMAGLTIPVIPVEHQYIVTDEIADVVAWRKAGNPEHPILRDADARWYMREERGGLILGPYENGAPAWGVYGVPAGFKAELLPPDLDRLEWHIEEAFHRMPCFAQGGVKTVYNGPISYTPDGNPLVGPAPGLRGFYLAEGFSFGITAAGGAGKYLTQMIVDGEAEIDTLAIDPRRFGGYGTRPYTIAKNEEAYAHVFVLHYPDEERPAARPLRTAPSYDRLKARGAVFGQKFGWERPNFYGPKPSEAGGDFNEQHGFRRGNWWPYAKAEAEAVRGNVGLIEAGTFAKYVACGPGANAWLDRLVANRLPQKDGRIQLTHALTKNGGTRSEFTIMRDKADSFYLVGAGAMETYDWDYLTRMLPADGSVALQKVTTQVGVFVVAGPNARKVLAPLVDRLDLGNTAFPWLTGRHATLGLAPVRLMRVNYVGELGWEIHHPIEYHNHIFDLLEEAGKPHDMQLVGIRAMNWLRLEKSYRGMGTELSKEVSAWESGLDRFLRLDKNTDFIGRAALAARRATRQWQLVTLLIDGPADADPWGVESIWSGGAVVGRATGGGYSVAFGKQIAMGFVRPDDASVGTELAVRMLGEKYPARVVQDSPYDPDNAKARA